MIYWLNGKLVPAEAAVLSPTDRGFTLGDGLFETLRVVDGAVLRVEAHLARLAAGAQVLALPLAGLNLAAALTAVVAANHVETGVVRLTVSRGSGPRGVLPPVEPHPTVLIGATALVAPASAPVRLMTCTVTRRNEMSPLSRIKSLNYLDNILARQEAAARGLDDALLLNTRGQVAEASYANLFAVREGTLVTPPVADGALPGIMRAEILRLGAREETLTPRDLAGAEEVFLSTSLGLRPVAELDGRVFAGGHSSYAALMQALG
ncbi:MAG: 2-keto-4-methylthiobutyrate aminotransferase [Rhizobiales bacterium 32-66-8]|nr:MAG: 2-keto-4-methylthiobutyrate aminotransferase [Rhizobiales bacterium 32-66-8]